MRCQYCNYEVTEQRFTCPACQFPLQQQAQVVGTQLVSTRAHTGLTSLSPGTVTLTKEPEVRPKRPLCVVFALDVSTSMSGAAAREAVAGLRGMIDSLRPLGDLCRMGLVEFNERARTAQQLTCPSQLEVTLDPCDPDGMTNIGDGLKASGTLLASDTRPQAQHVIVLLSDGADTCNSNPISEADGLKASALIASIAYGAGADRKTLRAIASRDDLFFTKATGGTELQEFLKKFGQTMTSSVQMGQPLDRSLSRLN